MKKKKNLYLAGNLGNWRDGVVEKLKDQYNIYNALVDSRQDCPIHFVNDDIKGVESSNILLAYRSKENPDCPGMAFEAGVAYKNGTIIIFVDETAFPDPLIFSVAKRFFTELDVAIEYLKYLVDGDEVSALHKAIEAAKAGE